MRKTRRRRASSLKVTIGDRTGWRPQATVRAPAAKEPLPPVWDREQRPVLSALAALPKLTAHLGFAVAARADATVKVLPEGPAAVVFTAAGKLRGMLLVPCSPAEAKRLLGLESTACRDVLTEQLWEEDRAADVAWPDADLHAEELS